MARAKAKSAPELDCQACGACCCNSAANKAEDYLDYVEVKARDVLSKRPGLVRHLCVLNQHGETHLKLVGKEQRCIALLGTLGQSVNCAIYEVRPRPCRVVEKDSKECHERRKDQGFE
jgi:Fe-S-cluster containining protein